jgi:hypothetical protein
LSPENVTYTASSVPLNFTVDTPTSWIGYSLDGEANVTIAGNNTLSGLTDGSHTIVVYATEPLLSSEGISGLMHFTVRSTIPIGGEWVPINTSQILAPLMTSIVLMTILTTSFVYVRYRRQKS